MLVLGRRKKVWGNPRLGIHENEEEVVLGDDVARTYLVGTTLYGDLIWDRSLGKMRGATIESALVGMHLPAGSVLIKVSPDAAQCFEIELQEPVMHFTVQLCLDERLYLHHEAFGEGGVLMVLAKIVHATHVRFGFVADRSVQINRLEVLRRIRDAAQVELMTEPKEGNPL